LPAGIADNPSAERLDKNHTQQEMDPSRRARLMKELQAFQNLQPDKQQHLRKLDEELHALPAGAVSRLQRSLVRYVEWLEGLPETKRNFIEAASDPEERLRRVRQLREQEWIDRLPKAYRNEILAAGSEARTQLIKKRRSEEKARRQEWQSATRHWEELQRGAPPSRIAELPSNAQTFVEKVLLPRMTTADAERLTSAEGKWPLFMETLVELSDRYAPFPGPARPKGAGDLPEEMRKRLGGLRPAQRANLQAAEGKWPEYPLALVNALRRPRGLLPPRLAPSKAADFDEPLQSFIRNQLSPRLTAEENRHLTNAEGAWPDYPKAVAHLSGKHNLIVPGMLPLPRNHVEKYRVKSPPAADR
jgi:hypothetical protein